MKYLHLARLSYYDLNHQNTRYLPKTYKLLKLNRIPPIGVGIVRKQFEDLGVRTELASLFDPDVEKKLQQFDIIGITVKSNDAPRAVQIAQIANRHGIPVIMGGYHPTLCTEELLQLSENIVCVKGESEGLIQGILEDLGSRKLKTLYVRDKKLDLKKEYILPYRDKRKKSFFNLFSVELGRGCYNQCADYCSGWMFQRGGIRERDPFQVIHEIEKMDIQTSRLHYLFLVDLNFSVYSREYLIEILSFLKKRNIKWAAQGTLEPLIRDFEKNGERLLRLMQAGCRSFLYGVDDIFSDQVRGSSDKCFPVLQKGSELFRRFEIPLLCCFVLGLDSHRYPDTFVHVRDVVQDLKLATTVFLVATPHPGTDWHTRLKSETRIVDDNLLNYTHFNLIHRPKLMSVEEFKKGYWWLLREVYRPDRLAQRISYRQNGEKRNFFYVIPWNADRIVSLIGRNMTGRRPARAN